MGNPEQEETVECPECGQALWYDEEEKCWVCDECALEFYEDDEDGEEEKD